MELITRLLQLHQAGLEHDVDEYDIEAEEVVNVYLQNLDVYRPEPDDPTRVVQFYYMPWWENVSGDVHSSAYAIGPARYLAIHRELVSIIICYGELPREYSLDWV